MTGGILTGGLIDRSGPDLDGFFGANEGSAIGVINAVKELGKGR